MNYIRQIQGSLDFIEEHITERITVEELAKLAGFSTHHYYKLFYSYIGIPVMEYVTRRKLQHALYELSKGERILDVAVMFGFETHAGFTKAFKRIFGYPPSFYRIHAPVAPPQPINLLVLKENKTGGIIMQPKIIHKEAFKVVGYEFKTTLRNNAHSRDIPAFWDSCNIEGKEATLYQTQPVVRHGEYGICINTNTETDEFSYVLGVEVSSLDKAFDSMCTLEVPAADYAVFTSPPVEEIDFVESIKGTWRYILEEWFPTSGYEIDDTKQDFEFYDQRCHTWENDRILMEIYVPLRKIED